MIFGRFQRPRSNPLGTLDQTGSAAEQAAERPACCSPDYQNWRKPRPQSGSSSGASSSVYGTIQRSEEELQKAQGRTDNNKAICNNESRPISHRKAFSGSRQSLRDSSGRRPNHF